MISQTFNQTFSQTFNQTRAVPKAHAARFTTAVKLTRTLSLVAVLLAASKTARAEEVVQRKIGVGYKLGNGIGFAGGDVILRLLPHVVVDVQASYASWGDASGFGIAPTVQIDLKTIGHTPYLGAGLVYAEMSNAVARADVTGLVANAGYEWRFASGLGLMAGAGVQDVGSVHAQSGANSLDGPDIGVHFNLEAGVRYFF
jgi:hypothetical protein